MSTREKLSAPAKRKQTEMVSDSAHSLPQVKYRFLEDYPAGLVRTYGALLVTEEEIVTFAERYDPQYIHIDRKAAAEGPFGGLIASGWLTAALTMRIFVEEYYNEYASLGGAGIDDLKFVQPVRPGDVLSARFTVLDARRSDSKPDRGILTTYIETLRQDQTVVLSMQTISIIKRRP